MRLSVKWPKTKLGAFCSVSYTGLHRNRIEGVVLNKETILEIFCLKRGYGKF